MTAHEDRMRAVAEGLRGLSADEPPGQPDQEFAALIDSLADTALAAREFKLADQLYTASDAWAEPSQGTRTARIMLLTAAMAGEEAIERAK
jgi:hypothetical protein